MDYLKMLRLFPVFACMKLWDSFVEEDDDDGSLPPDPTPEPAPTPGNEPVKQVVEDGITFDLDDEGNRMIGGVVVKDKDGVSVYNRYREIQKKNSKLAEDFESLKQQFEQSKSQPPQQRHTTQIDIIEQLRQQYPYATDEQIQMTLQMSQAVAGNVVSNAIGPYAPVLVELASNNVKNTFKSNQKDFPHYGEFEREINDLFDKGYPAQVKLDPKAANEAFKRCYYSVIGENISKIKSSSDDGKADIAGVIKGPRSGAPKTGKPDSTLTQTQLEHAARMNLQPKTYFELLKKQQADAKANNKPVPQLVGSM